MRTVVAVGCAAALSSSLTAVLLYAVYRRRRGYTPPPDPSVRVSRSLQAGYADLRQLVPEAILTFTADFHSRLADICVKHTTELPQYQRRVLDVLSGTGRTSFELSRRFEQVVGVEPDHDQLVISQQLQQFGHCVYSFSEEGAQASVQQVANLPEDVCRERVEFWPEDPCRLPGGFSRFGCVLVADTLTQLSQPASFLARVHRYVVPGGCLVIATSGDWGSSRLPQVDYLVSGEEDSTFDALRAYLEPHFECVAQDKLCRLIPITLRTYTLSLPEVSVWCRKYDEEQAL